MIGTWNIKDGKQSKNSNGLIGIYQMLSLSSDTKWCEIKDTEKALIPNDELNLITSGHLGNPCKNKHLLNTHGNT